MHSPDNRPHARLRHVFVVLRVRQPVNTSHDKRPLELDDVMATKAFFSQSAAEHEARRLNEANADFWRYFVRVARLPPEEEPEASEG